jgi:hypothetical protein
MSDTAAAVQAPPGDVLEYIEDMLSGLAAMAEGVGERRLATSMRLLAIEAARAAPDNDG